jgi:hypothetical protein
MFFNREIPGYIEENHGTEEKYLCKKSKDLKKKE